MTVEQKKFGILHIDDNRDILSSLKMLLRLEGYFPIIQVVSLFELRALLAKPHSLSKINAAIVDGFLKDGDGIQASKLVHEVNKTLPIISFSQRQNLKFGDVNLWKAKGPEPLLKALNQLRSTSK